MADNQDHLSPRAKVVVARVAAGAQAFQSAIEQRTAAFGIDMGHNADVVLFVVRGVCNSKHVAQVDEIEVCVAILTALLAACSGAPVTPAVEASVLAAVTGTREVMRAYKNTRDWLSRG